MAQKQESNYNLELPTDREVYAAIRYLDPDPSGTNEPGQLIDQQIYAAISYLLLIRLFQVTTIGCGLGLGSQFRKVSGAAYAVVVC
jgi:hypothetical protein